jgi:hypothetical protein
MIRSMKHTHTNTVWTHIVKSIYFSLFYCFYVCIKRSEILNVFASDETEKPHRVLKCPSETYR